MSITHGGRTAGIGGNSGGMGRMGSSIQQMSGDAKYQQALRKYRTDVAGVNSRNAAAQERASATSNAVGDQSATLEALPVEPVRPEPLTDPLTAAIAGLTKRNRGRGSTGTGLSV